MITSAEVLKQFYKYPTGSMIIASKLYNQNFSALMSEVAFSKTISRLCTEGYIVRISKGIYCVPKITKYGKILPTDLEIANAYVMNNKGMIVGYTLYNSLCISTQIPKTINIYSSCIEERFKKIGNVIIIKKDLEYTRETTNIITALELLSNYNNIQNINRNVYVKTIFELIKSYKDCLFNKVIDVISYPKWVIAFYKSILDYSNIANNLDCYLSSFSKYNIPKIEDLYDFA